ncbi:M20/M25/M40 family metallo-hydrolase [Chlamydiifrater phoenicopteri]|uniref:M20/M25/M40 family metallo-hydrolase n=1 Tax=Chlamydiifrater phoenicopteri TaxID=2681469 RepID=UPI001BD0F6F9|nr:M20/M25/M40 family metallo-hydrolase [Chlamydiifrater phoenicopteri]
MKHLSDEFRKNEETFLKNFSQFIAFKTVSADKDVYGQDLLSCAHFLENFLSECFSVETWSTGDAPPILFAYNLSEDPEARTLLIYCHYDVQPALLSDGWSSDPFILTRRGNTFYGRGVSDNKGQCFYTLCALRDHFRKHKSFPCSIKIILEGEEEIGSNALKELASTYEDRLQADDLIFIDGGFSSPLQPSVSIGARGLANGYIVVKEASKDLHSGVFGGAAYNPNRALSELLASLHRPDNSISVENFYAEVTQQNFRDEIFYEDITEECKINLHFCPHGMEAGFSVGEAISIRPTLEITGIQGGYTGEGFKTVIPSKSTAYLSCRLVPFQNPEVIWDRIIDHLQQRLPEGLHLEHLLLSGSPAWQASSRSHIAIKLRSIYSILYNKPCQNIIMGASIPIVPILARLSNASPLICGVSYISDNIHGPNEQFSMEQLEKGYVSVRALIESMKE